MKTKVALLLGVFLLLPLQAMALDSVAPSTDSANPEDGGLGATCWAKPFTASRIDGGNVCSSVGETQYPGINMIRAKQLTISACQEKNALDYGVDEGKSCYEQCAQIANCIYFSPNSEEEKSGSGVDAP